jgi:pimeloyl-ACP methyl ester carboxylesterase
MQPMEKSATSADGTPIYYEVHGEGQPTLVFVHGWCCNRSHWQRQVQHFASDFQVVGLVGADTLWDVERQRSPEQIEAAIADFVEPLRVNFKETAAKFAEDMFLPTSDATLRRETVAAMAAMPAEIGAGAMEAIMRKDDNLCAGIRALKVPIATINSAEQGETNMEAARRNNMEVIFMKNVGHFVMREDPVTFNRHLGELVQKMTR